MDLTPAEQAAANMAALAASQSEQPPQPPPPAPLIPPPPPSPLPPSDPTMDILFGEAPKPPIALAAPPAPAGESALPTDAELAKMPQGPQKAIRSMRSRIDEQNRMIQELKKGSGVLPEEVKAEVAKLKKQLDDTTTELERVSVERSPRFQARFNEPKASAISQITEYLRDGQGLDEATAAQVAAQAAGLDVKGRIKLLQEKAPDVAAAIFPIYAQIDALERQRKSELAKAHETHERDNQTAVERAAQFREKHFEDALTAVRDGGHAILKEIPGNEEWNKNVVALRETTKQVFASQDPQVQARAIALGVLAPHYLNLLKKENARSKVLEAELAKYGRAMPRVRDDSPAGGSGHVPPAAQTRAQRDQSLRDLAERTRDSVG